MLYLRYILYILWGIGLFALRIFYTMCIIYYLNFNSIISLLYVLYYIVILIFVRIIDSIFPTFVANVAFHVYNPSNIPLSQLHELCLSQFQLSRLSSCVLT